METGDARRRLFTLPLYRRESIGAAYHVLTFDADPASPLLARPGQFAMVRSATWGDAPLLPRPMSLLTDGERPSILIKVAGEGTRRMAHSGSGEPFHLLAPLGTPWSECPPDRRAVLVAGGVGVAPLLYLARALAASRAGSRAVASLPASPAPLASPPLASPPLPLALYGARTHADLPLDQELAAVSELRIATEDGSRGMRGRVTALLEEALSELTAGGAPAALAKVYACGPEPMMAAVARLCEARGVACEVSLETPMACGYGVCLGCPIPRRAGGFLYACTEGPCVDAAAIDWTAS